MKLVGKVKGAHGLKGDLYILIFSGDISWLPRLGVFGLGSSDRAESLMKCTVQRVKVFKDGFIVKANEINDRNQSEALKGKGFYIDDELLVSEPGETIYLTEILHFTVKLSQDEIVGPIVGFSSNGAQDLLRVEYNNKIVEIPFVQQFIKKIDFKNSSIFMNLPDGLLNLEGL